MAEHAASGTVAGACERARVKCRNLYLLALARQDSRAPLRSGESFKRSALNLLAAPAAAGSSLNVCERMRRQPDRHKSYLTHLAQHFCSAATQRRRINYENITFIYIWRSPATPAVPSGPAGVY